MTAQPTAQPPADPPAQSAQPAQRSAYSMGSMSNMLRSLLVMGLIVAGVIFLVPRATDVARPAVDALSKARTTAQQTGWPIELPSGLGDGWTPTVASFAPGSDKVPTFTTVWTTPGGSDIALKQAAEVSPAWLTRSVNEGPRAGSVTVGGRTFERYAAESGPQVSYVVRGAGSTDPTLVLTGTADEDELKAFAAALKPVTP